MNKIKIILYIYIICMEASINMRKKRTNKKYIGGLYMNSLITRKLNISIKKIGGNLNELFHKIISETYEGKCSVEGYIKQNSTKIISYSSGLISGSDIIFEVSFECLICNPPEGMIIKCLAKNVTKAGIRCEINEDPSPVIIFIARDHHHTSDYFANVIVNDNVKVRVIGQRYELNDEYISIIAELVEPKQKKEKILKLKIK
jgi:DNA-directed RNA polymerase subunit E'/Rpb7